MNRTMKEISLTINSNYFIEDNTNSYALNAYLSFQRQTTLTYILGLGTNESCRSLNNITTEIYLICQVCYMYHEKKNN